MANHHAHSPTLHHRCLACDLRERFAGTPLAQSVQQHQWPAHALVHRQDASLTRLHSVCSGLGALQQSTRHGTDRTIRLVEPGDVMGLEALAGARAQSNAITLLPSRTCSIPVALLLAQAQQTPWLAHHLHQLWLPALMRADFVIAELSTGSARARVSRLLLHLSELCGPRSVPDLSRSDMAALMALTTETVSRIMASLQREAAVHNVRGALQCDVELLKAASLSE